MRSTLFFACLIGLLGLGVGSCGSQPSDSGESHDGLWLVVTSYGTYNSVGEYGGLSCGAARQAYETYYEKYSAASTASQEISAAWESGEIDEATMMFRYCDESTRSMWEAYAAYESLHQASGEQVWVEYVGSDFGGPPFEGVFDFAGGDDDDSAGDDDDSAGPGGDRVEVRWQLTASGESYYAALLARLDCENDPQGYNAADVSEPATSWADMTGGTITSTLTSSSVLEVTVADATWEETLSDAGGTPPTAFTKTFQRCEVDVSHVSPYGY